MNPNPSDLECRVCREGPDEAHPLYFPCMCSGSIGAVHQSCLEEWLDVSKKDTCELCLTKYRFEAHYADGMPDKVSLYLFAKSVLKMFLVQVLPFILRVMIALVIWVLIVPVLTTCIYSVCVGRSTVVPIEMSWNAVRAHVVHGFNIDAVIAMSLLILVKYIVHILLQFTLILHVVFVFFPYSTFLSSAHECVQVSFTDFLRFHLVPNPPDGALAAVPNGMPAVVVEPAPNAAPVGEGRANAINAPAQVAAGAGAAEGNPQQHRQERARRPRRAQGAAAGAGVNDFGAQRRRQGRDTKRGSGNDRGAHAADADDQAGAAPETAPPATPAPAPAAPRMYRREDNPFYRPPTPTPVAAETLRQQAGGGGGRRTPGIAWDQPDDQPEHSPDIAGGEDGNTDDHGDHGDDDVPDLQSDSESSWETVSDDEGGDNGDAVDVEQVDAVRERVALNLLNQVQGEAAVNNAAGPAAGESMMQFILYGSSWI